MRIFLTGGTGYLGSRIRELLIAEGHVVLALARSEDAAAKLAGVGVEPCRCSLEELHNLESLIRGCDAAVHTAFDHVRDWSTSAAADRHAHHVLIGALQGSGRPVIVANGSGVFGDTRGHRFRESARPSGSPRAESESMLLDEHSIRGISIRLPLFVYGHGGSVFLPTMIAAARRDGCSYIVGQGQNRFSTVHVDDAARLFVLALRSESARGAYHAAREEAVSLLDVATAVASSFEVPLKKIDAPEAAKVWHARWGAMMTISNEIDACRGPSELGWHNSEPKMTDEIETGSYSRSCAARLLDPPRS